MHAPKALAKIALRELARMGSQNMNFDFITIIYPQRNSNQNENEQNKENKSGTRN
jgi:hypothetical protein